MAQVIDINAAEYSTEAIIADVVKDIDTIDNLLIILIDKEGSMQVTHTGLSLAQLATASKLIDKEFYGLIDEEYPSKT